MKFQVLSTTILLSLLLACQNNEKSNISELKTDVIANGIVNGKVLEEKDRETAPWDQVIGVVNTSGRISCSATLMDEQTVYTAAHCFFSEADVPMMALAIRFRFIQLGSIIGAFEEEQDESVHPESLVPYEQKVAFIDLYIKKYTAKLVKNMGLYFGDGVPGGSLEESDYEKNIASVEIDPSYLAVVREAIFSTLELKLDVKPLSPMKAHPYSVRDFAKVTLREPVKGTKPLELVSVEEFSEMVEEGSMRLIGYGYQLDREQAIRAEMVEKVKSGEKIEFPKEKDFGEESFEDLQLEAILKNYSIDKGASFVELPSRFESEPEFEVEKKRGVKMYTDTEVQGAAQEYLISGVKGETNGACNGDSGGGAFYKTKSGVWKYAGVINMKSRAGCGAEFYPLGGAVMFNANTATLIVMDKKNN